MLPLPAWIVNLAMHSCCSCPILMWTSDSSNQAAFYYPILVSIWDSVSFSWKERHLVWSSAAITSKHVVHLEMLFCTLWFWQVVIWVTVAFLLDQSTSAILLWLLKSARGLPLTGYFLFFVPFFINPIDGFVGKSKQISSFWNTQSSPSDTNNRITFDVTFLPHSDDHFEIQQATLTNGYKLKCKLMSCGVLMRYPIWDTSKHRF